MFYNSQIANEQAHIASAIVFELSKVTLEHVPPRIVSNFLNISEDLGARIAKGLGLDLPQKANASAKVLDLPPSPALSIQRNMKHTLEGRCVGILITNGSDADTVESLQKAVKAAGGTSKRVADKVNGVILSDNQKCKADGKLEGTPSQIFDAVAIVLSKEGTAMLMKEGAAVQFVMDAFGYLKAIGYTPEAEPLLQKAGVVKDEGITTVVKDFIEAAAKRFYDREPGVRNLA